MLLNCAPILGTVWRRSLPLLRGSPFLDTSCQNCESRSPFFPVKISFIVRNLLFNIKTGSSEPDPNWKKTRREILRVAFSMRTCNVIFLCEMQLKRSWIRSKWRTWLHVNLSNLNYADYETQRCQQDKLFRYLVALGAPA